ncbi:MAG: universal stress protein [Deltaproteobacteria bacterium]|nr:universal stress protein [Deltaproteobacteria bacterium]
MNLWNRLLVGVSEDPHSLDAVRYVASVLGGSDACRIRLVAVYIPQDLDAFAGDREAWADDAARRKEELWDRLETARRELVEAGLPEYNVSSELVEAQGRTVGATLMDEQKKGGFGTMVVGRRGLSKAEEFLFGSVSNTVIHRAVDCCVWVVA